MPQRLLNGGERDGEGNELRSNLACVPALACDSAPWSRRRSARDVGAGTLPPRVLLAPLEFCEGSAKIERRQLKKRNTRRVVVASRAGDGEARGPKREASTLGVDAERAQRARLPNGEIEGSIKSTTWPRASPDWPADARRSPPRSCRGGALHCCKRTTSFLRSRARSTQVEAPSSSRLSLLA